MGYRYPNLMVGTRSNPIRFSTKDKTLVGVRMCDGVVGDYQRVTLDADAEGWAYLYMTGADGVGDVPEGSKLAISIFARVKGGPCKLWPIIRRGNGTGNMHDWDTITWDDVGGGWTLCVTRATRNATTYDSQVLYVGLALEKAGTTFDVAQPMVCVADEPHAWAPSAGEVWPE